MPKHWEWWISEVQHEMFLYDLRYESRLYVLGIIDVAF
jgi:hypothetical protein